MKANKFLITISIIFLLIIFRPWVDFSKPLSSGDWSYLYKESVESFSIIPKAPFLWTDPYFHITAKIGVLVLNLPWKITERIFWFFPFLVVSFFSSFIFLKKIFEKVKISKQIELFTLVGSLFFCTNTYILMLVGGGQMGVAIAYSLTPLVLRQVFLIIEKRSSKKEFILSSFVLGTQLMFDPRIFLISLSILILYFLYFSLMTRSLNLQNISKITILIFVSVLFNLFWIVPNLNLFNSEYKNAVSDLGVNFLSFATFSNSLSLLHPNWPENIFGKITFMRPEFMLLPVIGFSSLFFVENNKNKKDYLILFFSAIALLGSFLSKGTNPPFGEFYGFLSKIPGFLIFRDPTKWYVMTVISYSILIPYSIFKIFEWLEKQNKFLTKYKFINLQNLFLIITLSYLTFLITPAIKGNLSGTFSPEPIPSEYVDLKNFLVDDKAAFSTLWIPNVQRYAYNTQKHKALSWNEIFRTYDSSYLMANNIKEVIKNTNIKYVIIPYDSKGEIFLNDRKYDYSLYKKTISHFEKDPSLRLLVNKNGNSRFGRIFVFEIINRKSF